ncbi:GNAT family N-acetyltransferase [Paenibacillus caui]|uniref:GNAT family N-acetyltransferase n=1 Tax=Paenibacillus caui TaxID=2873927 RepID=UPI001CA8B36E|nr:GNAT family protein [Paenibacillus caui]
MTKHPSRLFEGERLYLRPFTNEDSELYYSNLFDEELRRLTGTKIVSSKNMIDRYVERISTDSDRIQLLIVLKDGDRVIGDIALQDVDYSNRNAHLRIAIFHEEECGKGYGTEAIKLLLSYGFGIMNLHRIELYVYSFNERAIRSYGKIGFIEEGRQREVLFYNHEYHDSITMSILEHEFREKYVK